MPSEFQVANASTREEFPKVAEKIGEDPARFLDRPLAKESKDVSSGKALAIARIKGIENPRVAAAWLAVERRLERGPRDPIVDLLKARIENLRATTLPGGVDRTCWPECIDELPEHDRDVPEKVYSTEAGDQLTADERLASETAVATDGGEPS